ncbi:amidase family protein, partial [Burkholderia ambifaria]
LAAIAGTDPRDAATHDAPPPDDYLAALDSQALRGARIGVAREYFTSHDEIDGEIERAIAQLIELGATLVDPIELPKLHVGDEEMSVLLHEFKHALPLWLAQFAPAAPVKDLAGLIAWNEAHRAREMPWFGQELFVQAQALGGLD